MSFPSDYLEPWLELPQAPQPQAHPHPLRSHSAEDLSLASAGVISSARETCHSDRPDSAVIAHTNDSRGSVYTDRDHGNAFAVPQAPAATHPAFRAASTERFGDVAMHGGRHDFQVVPTRPPLRPTVSFGGETRTSYYSISSAVTMDFDKKPRSYVVVEELQQRLEQHDLSKRRSWRFYACFGILCFLRLLCGTSTTSLATALPVSRFACSDNVPC
jgi:hypothetical protein